MRRRFLARHPKSELYVGFGDFSFWRMTVASAHLNGGFARAADLTAQDVLTDLSDADEMIAAEEGAVAHMNERSRGGDPPLRDKAARSRTMVPGASAVSIPMART